MNLFIENKKKKCDFFLKLFTKEKMKPNFPKKNGHFSTIQGIYLV